MRHEKGAELFESQVQKELEKMKAAGGGVLPLTFSERQQVEAEERKPTKKKGLVIKVEPTKVATLAKPVLDLLGLSLTR